MHHLKEGDKAPDFNGLIDDDTTVSLKDFAGQKLVIFFYPKDNTPGCTVEACNLRDNYEMFQSKGYALLGVSPDSLRKHNNFKKKFELPFPLVADEDKEMMNAYGVWGPKKFMGRTFDGVHRTTFVIDENGTIERIINKVKTRNHTAQILEV